MDKPSERTVQREAMNIRTYMHFLMVKTRTMVREEEQVVTEACISQMYTKSGSTTN